MSSIGKIFVVLNLVLSLFVVGAAGALLRKTDATRTDIERANQATVAVQAQLDEANAAFSARERELTESKQRLQEEKDDLDVARQNLERANQKLDLDNQQLRDDVTKINGRLEALESSYTTTLQRSQELADKNDELRTEAFNAKEAQRQAELAKRDLTDQIAAAKAEASGALEQLASAQESNKTNEALLDVAVSSGFEPTTVMAMPRIEAMVAEVDPDYGFVILDKGKRDDVKRGFTFEVYRGGTYLGRVKVDETFDNYSTASIQLKAPDASMQRFDKASTYLN
jgi:hypothetical protein